MKQLRQYFLTGLLALLPIIITVYIVKIVVDLLDSLLPTDIFGLGLLLTLAFILLFGLLVSNILGKNLVRGLDQVLSRIPLIRGIYDASKQIVTTIFDKNGRSFKRVVYAPYPVSDGGWALGFVVNDAPGTEGGMTGVFVPFSPPTAGFLLFYSPDRLREANISIEEAMRLLLSGGTLVPRDWPGRHEPPSAVWDKPVNAPVEEV